MYPVKRAYSFAAYKAWRDGDTDLDRYQQSWRAIRDGPDWRVENWNDLREGVSFLTLMNKRCVLYFRGQQKHHTQCLATLFRPQWFLSGEPTPFNLDAKSRIQYLAILRDVLRDAVFRAVEKIGTPRKYILKSLPAATASVLQHYELWPTPFVDITRSLPTAVAFATMDRKAAESFLYVFAMPDLRGSVTTDMDQHIVLSRLEAICPPAAKRPHHQDAYLVARVPEPYDLGDTDTWDEWVRKSDLMRRLVARFKLKHEQLPFQGAPTVADEHLIPPVELDPFHAMLRETVRPRVVELIEKIRASTGP